MQKPLKVLALLYDENLNTISPQCKHLNADNTLKCLRDVLNCHLVTCTEIKVEGKYYDVWSDDNALLSQNPVPNLYISDDLIFFGNLVFAKSGAEGEVVGLTNDDFHLLQHFIVKQSPKLQNYWRRF